MNRIQLVLTAIFAAAAASLAAQSSSPSLKLADPASAGGGSAVRSGTLTPKKASFGGPFSHFAISGGISPMGVSVSAATNLNRYMNLRATGSMLNYSVDNISTEGFNVNAKLNLASAGTSLDLYPFPKHGLRFSPGVLFYNQNRANAIFTVTPGTSFTLNDYTYYASKSNPVQGAGNFGLHAQRPAFTATAGWGNMIPRSGKHWSLPFELGVAFIGKPTLDMALNSGQVCDANGQNCVDVASDATVQNNLQQQVTKYRNNIEPLKTYPIVSFGVAYSFRTRRAM